MLQPALYAVCLDVGTKQGADHVVQGRGPCGTSMR